MRRGASVHRFRALNFSSKHFRNENEKSLFASAHHQRDERKYAKRGSEEAKIDVNDAEEWKSLALT